jgi:hypothetical protein
MSYCVKIVMCVINMKLYWDVLVQQVFMQIRDIQDIDSFKLTWKIFNIGAIVITDYGHTFPSNYIFSFDNVNRVSLYNKSLGNWEISTSYWLGKYMTFARAHSLKSRWCGRPIHEPTQLSLLQFDCLTYFVLWKKMESQK